MRWRDAVSCALGFWASVAHAQTADTRAYLDVLVEGPRSRAPLTAADLVISDADGPLAVETLRFVELPDAGRGEPLPSIASSSEEREVARQADRLIGIFLDEYHLEPGEALDRARTQLATFIRTAFGPRDLFVVVKPLDSLTSLRLSGDREAVATAIEATDGRRGLLAARSRFEQEFIAGDPRRIEEARAQIALSALGAIASHLGQFDGGRKTLLVLSDALSASGRPRRPDGVASLDGVLRTATRGRVAVYVISPTGVTPAGDPGAPRAGGASVDVLDRLVSDTGGARSRGTSGLQQALEGMRRDASRYYLLGIVPRPGQRDGLVHAVRIATRRPGTAVRSRVGFSLADERIATGITPPRTVPATRLMPRHLSPLVQTWVGMSGRPGEPVRVNVVWEPAARIPGERSVRPTPQRVVLTVTTLDGEPVFSGTAGPTGQPPGISGRVVSRLSFDADPGPLVFQMDILDGAGRPLDRDVRDVVVKPVPAPFAFGTPELFRARTMRDVRELSGGADVSPVAARSFSRAEHLLVRVPIAGEPAGPIVARVVSGMGTALRTLPVTAVEGAVHYLEVDLLLATLAPGAYAVEFSVPSAPRAPIERVAFTTTP